MTAEEIATVERLAWGEGRIPVPIRQRPREVATFRAREFREGGTLGPTHSEDVDSATEVVALSPPRGAKNVCFRR